MNQQFRRVFELAQQADLIQWDTLPSGAKTPDHESVAKAQKFAELIVLECEKVAKDPQWYSKSPSNGWRNPINHVCSVMKEHFGVEE